MMTPLLTLVSIATCAVSAWMCMMYFILQHPGYQWRAAIAAAIFVGAAAVAARLWWRHVAARGVLLVWAAALLLVGVSALRYSDEGWALIAGLLFAIEGGLALSAIARGRPEGSPGRA